MQKEECFERKKLKRKKEECFDSMSSSSILTKVSFLDIFNQIMIFLNLELIRIHMILMGIVII